jgi:hypothetical protein
MKRSAFIAAASGYYLATMPDHGEALIALTAVNAHARLAEDGRRALAMASGNSGRVEAANIIAEAVLREQRRLRSIERFAALEASGRLDRLTAGIADAGTSLLAAIVGPEDAGRLAAAGFRRSSTDSRVPHRNAEVKGPIAPGGDWLFSKGVSQPLEIQRIAASDDVTYEIVNFIDGRRSIGEIRDAVSAEFAPVPLPVVAEYIDALAKAGAVSFQP